MYIINLGSYLTLTTRLHNGQDSMRNNLVSTLINVPGARYIGVM